MTNTRPAYCLAIDFGAWRMLEWFKRIKTPAPRAQLVDSENPVVAAEDKVKRLAVRLAADGRPAAPPNLLAARPGGTRVIAVCSQKGGVGKTTIAAHLAVRAAMMGQGPAVLVDTDPQGSLGEWWRARNDETLALSTVKLDNLADELATIHSRGAAVAVIDTPPALTASIVQVMSVADLIVIPARPSPHDLRAISATVDLVRRARKPFMFVVNGAANRAHITAECVAALSEHGRVAPVILYQRTEWASSMINGRTVLETAASGKSAQEIADLWDYAYAQITMRAAA
jgi:chromosome partitioning protein